MTNKDSKLIFEAYIEENLTKFEKDRLTAAGIMPEVAAMEYLSYEDDLANITGVTPHNSWYDHGGYDELGDPDDNLEDEHIAVVMVIGSGAAVVLFVDLADIQYDEGVYHGLHGPAFDQPASEMSSCTFCGRGNHIRNVQCIYRPGMRIIFYDLFFRWGGLKINHEIFFWRLGRYQINDVLIDFFFPPAGKVDISTGQIYSQYLNLQLY